MDRESFWDAQPALSRVRDAAAARGVGRWALLASCLARVGTLVPTDTVLPGIVGSSASLNFFVAIAAGSSGGKSTAQAVARELVPIPEIPRMPLSTGQGLVAAFVQFIAARKGNASLDIEPTPEHLERIETSILFTVDEIGDIAAKASNGSNNLMPVIRSAWGAEAQGSTTVTRENRLRLSEHAYRMSLIINTQLGASRFLLNDSDVGTPQRFLWVPAIDATGLTEEEIDNMTLADLALSGEVIRPIDVSHIPYVRLEREDLATPFRFNPVRVCGAARLEVVKDRSRAMAGIPVKYPPHHLLNRLKAASLLAWLCGFQGGVSDEFWELSGVLMDVSTETKEMLAKHAEEAEIEEAQKLGKRSAIIEDAKLEKLGNDAEVRTDKARTRILEKLREGEMSRREISQLFNSRTRAIGMTALAAMLEEGTVIASEDFIILVEEA